MFALFLVRHTSFLFLLRIISHATCMSLLFVACLLKLGIFMLTQSSTLVSRLPPFLLLIPLPLLLPLLLTFQAVATSSASFSGSSTSTLETRRKIFVKIPISAPCEKNGIRNCSPSLRAMIIDLLAVCVHIFKFTP